MKKLPHHKNIFIRQWIEVASPIGVVQIIHGMGEHSERYHPLAQFLNSEGYLVFATDHRGHGLSASSIEALGDITESFSQLVMDEVSLTQNIRNEYPHLPVFILGHSMGSFMAQGHMKEASQGVRAYILSGSSRTPYLKTTMGAKLGRLIQFIRRNKKSPLMDRLLFSGYNKGIQNNATSFDWLSRDRETVRRYVEDPHCGFIYCAGFYATFLSYLSKLFHREDFSSVARDKPLFILSGDKDPVGFYGRGVRALEEFYLGMGFQDIWFRLYREGRHEMLNETNREEVFSDILTFLKTYT